MTRYFFKSAVTILLSLAVCSVVSAKEITKSEADARIKKAGSTSPEWWDSVELTYPNTLDITWPVQGTFKGLSQYQERDKRGGPGDRGPGGFGKSREQKGGNFVADQTAQKIVDQYLIQIVYPNTSRHKEGIKLVNHLMIMHKDDKEKLKRSLNVLGHMFYELFDDYARAAFWWQKYSQMGGSTDPVKMARCYYELGSKTTAAKLLSEASNTNNKDLIKLWAKIGETDKALKLSESYTSPKKSFFRMGFGSQSDTSRSERFLLAGEICRGAGRYDDAIGYYEKVLALPDSETRPMDHHETDCKVKANANLEATRQLKMLDMKKVPDGSYSATTTAYGGPLTIKVAMKNGKIDSVKITNHLETPSYMVMAEPTTRQIITKQNFKDVDVITGATVTSDAIINTTVKALFNAMK